MNQLARQLTTNEPAPSASESISACRALFTNAGTNKKIRKYYNALEKKSKGIILIAAGLPPSDFDRPFEDFNDIELEKIRYGMKYLKRMVASFDNRLGDVRQLKHYQFSNTY